MVIIKLEGYIGKWDNITNKVVSEQLEQAKGDDVTIQLHSFGGEVFEGNLIYNTIKAYGGKVRFQIVGVAASMATIIMLAGDSIEIAENGYLMVHVPRSCLCGTSQDLKSEYDLLSKMERQFKRDFENRNVDSKKVEEMLSGSDYWLNAEEALEVGLVNKINKDLQAVSKQGNKAGIVAQYQAENKYKNFLNQDPIMSKTPITSSSLQEIEESKTIEALRKENETLRTQLKAQKNTQVVSLVHEAIGAKKITEKQKDKFIEIGMEKDASFLSSLLEGLNAKTSVADTIDKSEGKGSAYDDRKNWTWEDWQDKDPRGLEAMEKDNPKKLEHLFNEQYKTKNI